MSSLFPLAQFVGPTTTASPAGTATPEVATPSATPAPAATATTGSSPIVQPTTQPKAQGFDFSMILMIAAAIAVYFMLFRSKGGKEEKERKAMLDNLSRGDRILTIGGLIGSVVEVKGDEVVIKVDESNNVKVRYIKTAIQKVLSNDKLDKAEEKK